ncbi:MULTISPECIES: hypothetical protein [unclassified Sphingomonas]|uniref:hypothetical protein n=1 Tax=unclassified Sphingomonas TaxID=196159 RepID=UPI000AFDDBAB|nr:MULTISPECIES: hypothetical protein [unclassified Sphingomonas]
MDSQPHPTDRDKGNGVEVTTDEARAGATPHMTRYILGWGLALVIIAFLIVLAVNNWG